MLNIDLKLFKKNHKKNKNQVLYHAIKSNGLKEIENLINNFLNVRNSFVFESVEKGFIKGRYTIFGKNPDKIWEFNNNNCVLKYENKRKKLRGTPKDNIEKIIENFNFKIPSELPPISSIISGYFSYDTIRYIEKIPNNKYRNWSERNLTIDDPKITPGVPKNNIWHKIKMSFLRDLKFLIDPPKPRATVATLCVARAW